MMRVCQLLLAAYLLAPAHADIPVHCLHENIRGRWTFHLGPATHSKESIQCSAGMSSKDYAHKDRNFGLGVANFQPMKTVEVELSSPNIATMEINGQPVHGTWTMIYDEGFEVRIADTKFFAFSKFLQKPSHSVSYCGETYPGWYHPSELIDVPKWGCYFGVKNTPVPSQVYRKFGDRPIKDVYVPEDELVAYVNNAKTTWKAKRYTNFENRPMKELQRSFGNVLSPYKLRPEDISEQQIWAAKTSKLIQTSDIPEAFDWTNVNGKDFVGPVENQGGCGSCYAVSVAEMIASRVNILNKQAYRKFSASPVVDCAFYSQGCSGGFPYLSSKYAQDFGAAHNSKYPYQDFNQKCKMAPDKVAARLVNYKYVGGYYGGCSEAAMRREIFDHGPLVVGFEVGLGFNSYSSGVFRATEHLPEKNHWERVNHAVLIVGFGKDKDTDTPYWKVKNSWGRDWGEHGFFRIQRGDNNLNIEHMAVAAYPSTGAKFPPEGLVMVEEGQSYGHLLSMGDNVVAPVEELVAEQVVPEDSVEAVVNEQDGSDWPDM